MEKKRLQFDFTKEALEELDLLQERTGLSSRADLIRHALRFFQWTIVETLDKNGTLLIERDGQTREIMFPFWLTRAQKQDAETSGYGIVNTPK